MKKKAPCEKTAALEAKKKELAHTKRKLRMQILSLMNDSGAQLEEGRRGLASGKTTILRDSHLRLQDMDGPEREKQEKHKAKKKAKARARTINDPEMEMS